MESPVFSVIVPVYNRPAEVGDLVESLKAQTENDFELIVVEDGSTEPCRHIVEQAAECGMAARYFYKTNQGRSIARNYGMERARGRWLVFFDSDCVIPPDYFSKLRMAIAENPLDCYGGPDAAHSSFSAVQKAINFAMTSFLTTGGIRGGRHSMEKFTPRTFNMGFTRQVYQKVGGFREMFSEDIDMSTRIRLAGFSCGLYRQVPVWHKRRVDFKRFWRQVYVFGMSRITLQMLYPGSMKLVHTLPAFFVVSVAVMAVLAAVSSPLWLLPLGLYLVMILGAALAQTRSARVALLAVPASMVQLCGYGCGFIKAWTSKILLGRGRDIDAEVAIRKGK